MLGDDGNRQERACVMGAQPYLDPTKRHDFVLLFDVTDGNPNGDPDAGNLPRMDPETMQGLVSDGAIKRKVRDWVEMAYGGRERYRIYVQNKGVALNTLHQGAYSREGLTSTGAKQKREDVEKARARMCAEYFDVRAFGAVMTTGVNCGQVRGPAQITIARSIDPIVPLDFSITRVAITKPEDVAVVETADGRMTGKTTEMGRKALVPYALYKGFGFFTPHFARQTGFEANDLVVLWEALQRMWDLDRSASRGLLAFRGLAIFSHEHPLGNAPAHMLLERVQASLRPGVEAPRAYNDYQVTIRGEGLPQGVTLTRLGM
jgi:CRISPR-associated protein Csd2